jgi:hypothetical protein
VDLDEASEANYRSIGYTFRVIDDIHDIYNCYYLIASQEIMKIGCFSLGLDCATLGQLLIFMITRLGRLCRGPSAKTSSSIVNGSLDLQPTSTQPSPRA